MTLNEVMKETADAIREKTGKSELIKPIDFASEIKGITAGGGESGGEKYYIFSQSAMDALPFAHLIKFPHNAEVYKLPLYFALSTFGEEIAASIEAFSLNPDEIVSVDGGVKSIKELLPLSSYTEITREEFYDLNA
jgi:hypothetical protein